VDIRPDSGRIKKMLFRTAIGDSTLARGCGATIETAGADSFADGISHRYGTLSSHPCVSAFIWRRTTSSMIQALSAAQFLTNLTNPFHIHVNPHVLLRHSSIVATNAKAALQVLYVRRGEDGSRLDPASSSASTRSPVVEAQSPIVRRLFQREYARRGEDGSRLDPVSSSASTRSPVLEARSPMVQRLFQREARIDSTSTNLVRRLVDEEDETGSRVTPRSAMSDRQVSAIPVFEVLKQPANSLDARSKVGDGDPIPGRATAVTPFEPSNHAGRPAVRKGDDTIDLNVLTDRVVQAIDRRVIAQRERVGRW
jgi:hypothetical protein